MVLTLIYEALYNPCINEGGACTLSLHKSVGGALEAVEVHKKNMRIQWLEWFESMKSFMSFEDFESEHPFGQHEWWGTRETILLD